MALRIGDLTEATSFVGTDVLELSLAGSAGSRRTTGSNLRKQLFAGGTGFTASDPLICGALTATTGTFSGALTTTSVLKLSGAAGTSRDFSIQTSGVDRWIQRVTSTAESGGNAGSNWELLARDDTGAHIITAISVTRATGAVTFGAGISATTGTFSGAVQGASLVSTSNIELAAASAAFWTGRSRFRSPADGQITLLDSAETAFSRLQFGGTTSSFPSLKRSGVNLHARLADDSDYAPFVAAQITANGAVTSTSHVIAGASSQFHWSGIATMIAPSDGVIQLLNNAATSFGRLQFGGSSSSFPSLKRSSAELQCRLADDSGYAAFQCGALTVNGTFNVTGAFTAASINLGGATVLDILTGTVTTNLGSIAAGGFTTFTITVTGAVVGDPVFISAVYTGGTGSTGDLIFYGQVSANDTVLVSVYNPQGTSRDPDNREYRAVVFKF